PELTSRSYPVTGLPPSLTTSTVTRRVSLTGLRATSCTVRLGPPGRPYAETGLLGWDRKLPATVIASTTKLVVRPGGRPVTMAEVAALAAVAICSPVSVRRIR